VNFRKHAAKLEENDTTHINRFRLSNVCNEGLITQAVVVLD
jgi:hypothetical protein